MPSSKKDNLVGKELNTREKEILTLISAGNAYKEISQVIGISLPTIKLYIRSAKEKLGTKNLGQTIAVFVSAR